MRNIRGPVAVLLLGALAGCATTTGAFDRHFQEGRYGAAIEEGEGDSGVMASEEGLYRLALAYLASGTGVHDPMRAEGLLNEVLARHPEGNRALEARILVQQLATTRRVSMELHRAQWQADSVRTELGRVAHVTGTLEVRAEEGSREVERLRARVRTLETDLQSRTDEVAGLQRTLDELKRIDLRRTGGTPLPVPIAPAGAPGSPR